MIMSIPIILMKKGKVTIDGKEYNFNNRGELI